MKPYEISNDSLFGLRCGFLRVLLLCDLSTRFVPTILWALANCVGTNLRKMDLMRKYLQDGYSWLLDKFLRKMDLAWRGFVVPNRYTGRGSTVKDTYYSAYRHHCFRHLQSSKLFATVTIHSNTQYKSCQLDTSGFHSLKFVLTSSHPHNANHQAHHLHLHTRRSFCLCYSNGPRSWNEH